VAGDVREGPEMSRRIRDELERIRDAEDRVADALETVRQARRRVELVARELGREEERVRAWVRDEIKAVGGGSLPGSARAAGETAAEDEAVSGEAGVRTWRSDASPGWSTWREPAAPPREPLPAATSRPAAAASRATPADERRPAAPEVDAARGNAVGVPAPGPLVVPPPAPIRVEDRSVWVKRGAIGAAAALVVALIGWFAIRGLQQESASTAAEEAPAPVTATAPVQPAAPPPAAVTELPSAEASSPLATLPTDPSARQALYDSLFAARSALFDPLLAQVQSETSEQPVQRALAAWREGPVDAQDADLIHSSLLQHVLKAEIDPRIEVDGQVLRNPCRGRSCSALLNAWEQRRDQYGLPPVPENAPTDPRALRQAEAALVLSWLRQVNVAQAATP
jgi:hypothetical protein